MVLQGHRRQLTNKILGKFSRCIVQTPGLRKRCDDGRVTMTAILSNIHPMLGQDPSIGPCLLDSRPCAQRSGNIRHK